MGGKGHFHWRNPQGRLVTTTPGTTASARGIKNAKAVLKRNGLQWLATLARR